MSSMIPLLIALLLTPDWTMEVTQVAKLTLKYEHGDVAILRVDRETLPSPKRLQRFRGRYEARAGDGKHDLELVRFDFPLMALAEAPEDATMEAQELGRKLRENVTATTTVRVPLPPGATTVTIYDTTTKKAVSRSLGAVAAAAAPATAAAAAATPATRAAPPPPAAATANTRK
jgi:hypothetical protein